MKPIFTLLAFFAVQNLSSQNMNILTDQQALAYFTNYTVEKNSLDGMINSPFPDVRPYISPDGSTLYFGRRDYPDNFAGSKDPQDIWFSTLSPQGLWNEPQSMGSPLNDKRANAICNISPDGKTGIFYNTRKNINSPLVKSFLTNTGWSEPDPIIIEGYYNHNQYADFYVAFYDKVMLMAIERDTGLGDQDLYVSHLKKDGSYSTPVNLGNTINGKNPDYAPFLAPDGTTLFFVSSNREGGFGSSDIYMSQRLDNSWQSWSKPINLGESVNTEASECFFSISSDLRFIFIDSKKPNVFDRNIRVVAFPEELKPNRFQAYMDLPKGS